MEEAKNKRIYWIDIIKIIAMFFIVLSHTIAYSKNLSWLYKYVSSFHVVLFFTISGLTFNINKYKNYKQFFIHKFKTIMIPYFVFATLFLIPFFLLGNNVADELGRTDITVDFIKPIVGIFYGNGHDNYLRQNSALWFLPCLFVLENIYYFIENIKNKNKHYFAMAFSLIIGALDYYFLPIRLPWGMDIAFVMIFFFAIARIFPTEIKNEYSNIHKSKKIIEITIALCFVILGGILQIFNVKVMYMHNQYGNYIIFILSALSSILGYFGLISNCKNIKFLTYAGQRTMSILIFHKLIVLMFQTKIKPIANLLNNSIWGIELVTAIIIVIIAMVISLIVGQVIQKFCPILFGKKKEKK